MSIEFPEPVEMSPEAEAMLHDPTDPNACTCEHEGLPIAWHRTFCELYPRRDPA